MEWEPGRTEDIRRRLEETIAGLQELQRSAFGTFESQTPLETSVVILEGMQALLAAANECQMDIPFADMRYINRENGLYLCCTHTPEHCVLMWPAP